MISRTLLIEPRDPVIFRDGKPFSAGLSAKSIGFPLPSTVIGAIRTRCGAGSSYDTATVERLLKIEQTGPFLAATTWDKTQWEIAFQAPADVVAYERSVVAKEGDPLDWQPLRPQLNGEGCDLPGGLLPLYGARAEKPAGKLPAFWHWNRMEDWLRDGGSTVRIATRAGMGIPGLPRQKRMHVGISPDTQTAEDGMLFATEGLEFCEKDSTTRLAIVTRIRNAGETAFEAVSHIGGEGRAALWAEASAETVAWPPAPEWLKGKRYVRLILATPGAFKLGYRPGWLETEKVPGVEDVSLRLMAAAVPRGVPISGWDMAAKNGSPKASRLLAPAGSVYFCEVVGDGDPRQLWMKSISDNEEDRRAGFGIVLVGEWSWPEN